MPRALKVFRTAVGFRDAYVAAPSKAAALRAWGTDKDLFARGAAELVTDPALTAEALSRPGEVVYRTRGGLEEQVAALGPLPKTRAKPLKPDQADAAKPSITRKPKPSRPRPSRSEVEAAEAELQALQEKEAAQEAQLHEREQALARERKQMEQAFATQRQQLQQGQASTRRLRQGAEGLGAVKCLVVGRPVAGSAGGQFHRILGTTALSTRLWSSPHRAVRRKLR